ncbi:cobalamin biosynthesis protein [Sphingobium mellinum]|uniref:cobalamin biosynthesis protein n=1 Tax=Sphingobium mellinum TaxID=1387166 RepID=UPI0030EB72F5
MIVAGFGCRTGTGTASLRAALDAATPPRVDALATLTGKAALLAPLARALGLPLLVIDPADLAHMPTLTCSSASLAAYRTGSVAEAVALAAAGPGARLLAPRSLSPDRRATCALASGARA